MRQEQIILDAVQNPIDDVEEYPDARLVESQTGTKDILGAVVIPQSKSYTLPSEPSWATKLWLWFREGWRLKDHSLKGNEAFAEQVDPSPFPILNYVPIRRKYDDDGLTDGRLYGIINGLSQYYRVKDGPNNRITDLLVTDTDICFSIYFSPFEEYTFDDETGLTTIFSKLDDDQIQNAIRVDVNEQGGVIFSLIYKGNAYQVSTSNGVVPVLDPGEFFESEFDPSQFKTTGNIPNQFDADVDPQGDWTWLFFTFNKNTRILKVIKVSDTTPATQLVASTTESGIRTTFSMHIPGNEGASGIAAEDPTRAYDIINDNDAVFAASPNSPTFVDGLLKLVGDTKRAEIANHSTINTLSTFTIALKIRPTAYSVGTPADYILTKGNSGNGGATTAIGGLKVYLPGSGSTNLSFSFKPDSNPATQTITMTNAVPTLNQWYSVIITYNGTTYTLYVGNMTPVTLARSGDVFTNSNFWTLGDTISSFQGNVVDIIVDKGTAWNSTQRSWYLNKTPGFKAGFPNWKPPKPPEPEEPTPVVRPQEKVYEVVDSDTSDTVKLNNPASATPFVSEYNVAGGTPSTTPEELKYDVADGTTGGGSTNPWTTVYSLAPQSSTGNLNSNEVAYGQQIQNGNSALEGIKPTEITCYIKQGSASGGTVYLGIIKENGSTVKFGTGISVSSIPDDWTQYVRQGNNTGTQYTTVVGDAVGVIWENGSSGTLNIQRGGADNHSAGEDGVDSQQGVYDGSGWSNNSTYSMAGQVRTGGETVSGTNPWHKMTNSNWVCSMYQLNSTLENITPSKVMWRVRRVGSAASATVVCRIRNASSAIVYTFPQTISFNSIGTTVQDLEFTDVNNTAQWQDGFKINLEYLDKTGINDSTVYLEVNFNVGPSNAGVIGGTAIKAQYYRTIGGYTDVSPAGTDWAGKIYIGGASFTSYKDLDNTCTRVGEKVAQFASPNISRLFGDKLSKWNVTMKKSGSPTGQIRVKCYNGAGAETAVFNTILDASSLTTSDVVYPFIYPTNQFVMDGNSRIVVEYTNGTATDKVLVKINTDAAAGANADGTKSVLTSFKNGAWVDENTLDVAGEIFSGGVPDQLSRPKAAIRCDSIFSQVYQDKITRVQIKLKKLGAPTGTYYIRSVRGSDGSNRDLLGSGDIATLSTSTWTLKDVSNTNAIHYLGVSDKIVIEYEGGNLDNALLVQVKKDSTYDDEDTRYEEFDGVQWNKDGFETWDIRATLWIGGDTYTPDAGTPYVEPPDYYDHDLLIGAGAYIKGGFNSFYGMRIRDFRIFTEAWTLEEMDTVFDNKYSKRGSKGSLALVGYFTLTADTEPPE